MALIENSKIYSGNELEAIFFRPMLAEQSLKNQGVRVLFNMPVPTAIHLWETTGNVLKPYENGWQGDATSAKTCKTLDMRRVKAESAFSAADYYAQVYEHIVSRPDVNLQDLTGTDLEQAETALFKKAIADDLRITTWVGNVDSDQYNTFDGIFKKILAAHDETGRESYVLNEGISAESVVNMLHGVWNNAPDALKALKKDGHLAFYVSSNLYQAYEDFVYANSAENSALCYTEGFDTLYYRGIPVVDLGISEEMLDSAGLTTLMCLLTDSRNLVLALNTADYPDAEVRMWYNPDQMENRQRAVFLASADFIDFDLTSSAHA